MKQTLRIMPRKDRCPPRRVDITFEEAIQIYSNPLFISTVTTQPRYGLLMMQFREYTEEPSFVNPVRNYTGRRRIAA